ncbi:hypothetical protein HN592_03315 [Candidatus Woesearchaeota archaeon]|jgi:hypothetical protein|nr:hypothetical protein [Candidatus Woesearchaeota archaeon]MBT4368241.1 hypothetical protein [Candidatus Woesearchaeota archaeon]MBT4712730.1 hypothetical protein [Candidatus Woesearchaeota archaeon]MBT6639642.1 hypothetical protein [Candidatus Woesearchaeota archaeon]MBT7133814.1 hypothetical protein [Candidatus Woesearchaeota archaeon]
MELKDKVAIMTDEGIHNIVMSACKKFNLSFEEANDLVGDWIRYSYDLKRAEEEKNKGVLKSF